VQCTNQAISFDCVGVEEVAHVMEGDPLPHSLFLCKNLVHLYVDGCEEPWTSGRELKGNSAI